MKTIIIFVTLTMMISIISACSKQESAPFSINQDNKEYKDIFPIFKLWWKIARPSTNCTERWGLCEGHFILLGWQIFKSTGGDDFGVNGSGTII